MMLARLRNEPLFQFAFGGAVLFALYQFGRPATDPSSDEPVSENTLVLTTEFLEGLRLEEEARTGRRPRSVIEEAAMIARYRRNEALFRQAQELGLDRGDPLVRRRLIQKMEFLLRDASRPPDGDTPPDHVLAELLEEEAERFVTPSRLRVEHVFFSSSREAPLEDARRMTLEGSGQGDAFPRTSPIGPMDRSGFERAIAPEVGARLFEAPELEIGVWSEPIESALGVHRVRILERVPGATPALEEVSSELAELWREQETARRQEAAMQRLLERYPVVTE